MDKEQQAAAAASSPEAADERTKHYAECAAICRAEADRIKGLRDADVWCGYADTGALVCANLIDASPSAPVQAAPKAALASAPAGAGEGASREQLLDLLRKAEASIRSMATWFRNQPLGCPPAGTAQLQSRLRAALAGEPAVAADEGRKPPFGSKRKAALALYRPPFKFTHGYIFDAGGQMVADQDGCDGKVETHIAARVRGWGRIGYMPDPEALQDEVGAILAEALTAFWPAASHDEQQEKQR